MSRPGSSKFISVADVAVLALAAYGIAGLVYIFMNPEDLEKLNASVFLTLNIFLILSLTGVLYWAFRKIKKPM